MLRPWDMVPRRRNPLDRTGWPEDVHVMPTWEDHNPSPDCPCCPRVTWEHPVTKARVWTHRETN